MDSPSPSPSFSDQGYTLENKLAMSAVAFLIILGICFNLYDRRDFYRRMRRNLRLRIRRNNLVFYADQASAHPAAAGVPSRGGLDAAVLKSLPVFVYSSADPDYMECAVCLLEFGEKEVGLTLPKCAHSFHKECIDMWFHSHSTCPLCHSPAESAPALEMVERLCDSSWDLEAGPSASIGGRKSRGELGNEVPGGSSGESEAAAAAGVSE